MLTIARYEFRSKQQYIFRTNALREVVGASALITEMYERLVKRLARENIRVERNYELRDFKYTNTIPDGAAAFSEDFSVWEGKILVVGGGSLYAVWKNRDIALEVSRIFCQLLREEAYDLSLVCGLAPYTGNYAEDLLKVNEDFARCKAVTPPFLPSAITPFTELDRKTSLPIAVKDEGGSFSMDSWLKRKQSESMYDPQDPMGELRLDRMVPERGDESLLAVIHVDGNNMGERVRKAMNPAGKPFSDYSAAVRTIRSFSNDIQECFVTRPLAAVRRYLQDHGLCARLVVAGGDDVTWICNARHALALVKTYFEALAETGKENTACAGICIFHSHSPFSTAYQVAEECCENAKKTNRQYGGTNSLIDFQFCYAGVVGSLETMRKMQDGDMMARPYLVGPSGSLPVPSLGDYEAAAKRLSAVGRANIKGLAELSFESEQALRLEFRRLKIQFPEADIDFEGDRKFLLDVAQFYDIWFDRRK